MSSPFAAEDEGAFHPDDRARLANAWPRYVSLLMGAWMFVSAFAWPHSRDACAAAWISGAGIGMNAFAAIWASQVRYFTMLLGGMSLVWQASAAGNDQLALISGVVSSGLVIAMSFVPPQYPRREAASESHLS
ncbi:MAG TPA: hypothetical protein VHB79_14885 [Polyangiaceae bacterium]|nr:hypothetical protein [Polyangiaceae bacterium]